MSQCLWTWLYFIWYGCRSWRKWCCLLFLAVLRCFFSFFCAPLDVVSSPCSCLSAVFCWTHFQLSSLVISSSCWIDNVLRATFVVLFSSACLQIPYLMADLFFILQLMNFGLRAFSSHEQCIVFIFWTDLVQFLTIFSEFYIVHLLDLLFMTLLFEYLKCRHCSVLDCPPELSSALYIHCFTGGPSPFLCCFRQIQKHHFLYLFLFRPLQIYSWTFPPFTLCLLTWQLQAS